MSDTMSEPRHYLDGRVTLHPGDCREMIKRIPSGTIDSVVTDPPYALVSIGKRFGKEGAAPSKPGKTGAYARASAGFMGKSWDTGETAFAEGFWREVFRVLKPGGHVAAFGGTRTYHRLACAIEDAGFEIRDQLAWTYGTGFPKSHDIAKAIDKRGGHHRGKRGMPVPFQSSAKGQEFERNDKGEPVLDEARRWKGWGSALRPAWEPVALARKPLEGTLVDNVLKFGTGALNIDGCWIGGEDGEVYTGEKRPGNWPANIVHDGSAEVLDAFPADGLGSRARFFYSSKADDFDRIGSKHPTVKPVDLMQWLTRMVTPPGGTVLDPFSGTGSTGEAAWREGFAAVLIEREAEYQADIARRMALAIAGPAERKGESIKARGRLDVDAGPLFGGNSDSAGGGGGRSTGPSHATVDRPDRAQAMSEAAE